MWRQRSVGAFGRNCSVVLVCAALILLSTVSSARGAEPHAASVQLPDCKPSKSHVKVIRSDSDWNAINDSQFRVFCVTPGNYRSAGVVTLRESGTANKRRYLRIWRPNSSGSAPHPVSASSNQRALVKGLHFVGADYWTIDGLTSRGGTGQQNPTNGNMRIRKDSDHNIFNRMLVEYGRGTLLNFDTDSDDNVFQRGVIRDAHVVPNDDNMCVNFSGRDTQRNRVVWSELYDCTDSVHVSPAGPGNNRGTVVAYNDLYITPDMYSDCNGSRDPNGSCACAENAIDVKAVQGKDSSGEPEKNWLKIIGNRMWGFQNTDTACGGTGSAGGAVTVHYARADFVLARRNIIFDSPFAWTFSAPGSNNVSLVGNLAWDLSRTGLFLHDESARVEAYYNTIVDVGNHHSNLARAPSTNEFKCNTVVNAGTPASQNSSAKADYNAYFNSQPFKRGPNDLVKNSASAAQAKKFCFERRIWTGPKKTCVPHVLKTSNSPHRNHCDPNLGSRSGTGVNDTADKGFFKPDWRSYGRLSVRAAAQPGRGARPMQVQLDASVTGGSKPFSFTWTFDDGATQSGNKITRTYQSTGTYTPEVEVTDANGRTASDSVELEVLDPSAFVFSSVPYYGNATHWEPRTPSRWTVEQQGGDERYFLQTTEYSGAGGGQPGEVSLVRNRQFEDFDLRLRVKTNEDLSENTGADFVVVFGWRDSDNYHFILGHTQKPYTKLFTVEDGERRLVTKLGSALLPDASWQDLEVRRDGAEVTVSLDGGVVKRAQLSTSFTGRLGVGSFNESVYFDDIDVKPRGGLSRPSGDGGIETGPDAGADGGGAEAYLDASGTGAGSDGGGARSNGDGRGCSCAASEPSGPGRLIWLAVFTLGVVGFRRSSGSVV